MGRARQRGRAGRVANRASTPDPRPPAVAPGIDLLEAVWLAAIVTIPVAVNPFASASHDTEKALLLRFWGLLAGLLLGVRLLAALLPGLRRARSTASADVPHVGRGVLLWLAAVVGTSVVSATLALSRGNAWWGGASRGGGVLTVAAAAVLFAAVAMGCTRRVQCERLLLAVLLGSVLPTAVGALQVAGVPILTPSSGFPENRPWATFGNAIAFGSFLVASIPVAAYHLCTVRRWRKLLPGLLLAAQAFLLLRTASRGPMLGLLAGTGLAAVCLARRRGWRNAATAGACGIVVLLGVFLGGIQLVARSDMVRRHTRTGMLTRYNTVEVRVQLYKALTARMLDAAPLATPDGHVDARAVLRPWFGYGPECLSEPLLSRVTTRFELAEGYDHVPDSTHSALMDVLGGCGGVGLVAHLGFLAALAAVGRRALRLRPTRRVRRIGTGVFVLSVVAGVAVLVALWGAFAWALGVLAGAYVGLLLTAAVMLFEERKAPCPDLRSGTADMALAVVPALFGLWVEAQFGIALVSSTLLFFGLGGLLVALARRAEAPVGDGTDAADAPDASRSGWVAVAVLAAFATLVASLLHNAAGATEALDVLRQGVARVGFEVLAGVAVLAAAWALPSGRRVRVLPGLALAAAVYLLWHGGTLAGLRVGTLRSIDAVVDWGGRLQRAAWMRHVPILVLPVLLTVRRARGISAAILATVLASLVFAFVLWRPVRQDILLESQWRIANGGEPRAAVAAFERTVGRESGSAHYAHQASQARLMAARAARAEAQRSAGGASNRWDAAIRWGRAAVAARPLYAPHHAELGGVLEEAARAQTDARARRELAREAASAHAAAVALAPGLTVHRRRLAGALYTLLGDAAGARRVLEETLTLDPQNPVALSMLARWTAQEGRAASDDAARATHFRDAILFAERCLKSRTIGANRVDVAPIRRELSELQRWFREAGLPVPTLKDDASPQPVYVAPKLPTPADRRVLRAVAMRGGVALALALLLTPCVRVLARRAGYVDVPSARKVHVEPTPLLGGLAIAVAVVAAWFAVPGSVEGLPLGAVLGVAACLAAVGLVDDRWPLPWWAKLGAQCAAAFALYRFGVRVQLAWLPAWANLALTLAWLVGITNAVNFLDNMNGLSAGLSALVALAVAVLGVLNEGWAVAGVAAAVAGGCLGFLRYNHHWRATIFMGDTGSLFLGCLLACLALLLRFPANHNWVTWLCPVLLLAVPVFDMTHVCVARLRRGKNPLSTPGKDHTSHLLARMGLERHGAVLAIHGAVLLCGAAAGTVAYASTVWAYALAGAVFAFAVFLLLYFELRFGKGGTEAG